jgi:hypothetical protein
MGIDTADGEKALPENDMISDRWGDWGLFLVNPVAAPLRMIEIGPVCGSATSIEEEQP